MQIEMGRGLPAIQQIDVATPVNVFYQSKQRAQDMAAQKQQMDEFERQKPMRLLEEKLRKVQTDQEFQKLAQPIFLGIDTKSKNYDMEVNEALNQFGNILKSYNFTDQEIAVAQERMIASGSTLKPIVERAQAEMKKQGEKAPSGYRWTQNGNLEAIPGGPAVKEEKSPTTAMGAFLKQNPDATADEIAEFSRNLSNKSSTTVNVNTAEGLGGVVEKEASKKYGQAIGERVDKRFQQADEANNQNARLDQVALALSQGAKTGFGEETILNLKSAAQTMGLDVGDLSGQELIRKVSNEMALRLRNPESGLGLTGNTSNKDLQFLKDSVVGLGRTEQGNRSIINATRKFNRLKIDTAIKQSEIISENDGIIPKDIDKKLMEYVNGYELFTNDERKQLEGYLKTGESSKTDVTALSDEELMKKLGM